MSFDTSGRLECTSLSKVILSDAVLSVVWLGLNLISSMGDLCVAFEMLPRLEEVVDMMAFLSRMPSLIIVPRIRAGSDTSITCISNGSFTSS